MPVHSTPGFLGFGTLSGIGEDEEEFPDCIFIAVEFLEPGGLAGLSLVHASPVPSPGWPWTPGQHKTQHKAGV